MQIQLSTQNQIDEIFKLLQACAAHMRSQGIMQWNENHPLISHIQKDIENKSLYDLIENDIICGIVVIDENQSPEYKEVEWEFDVSPILVVHRFAVLPSCQKKGIGKQLMDFALDYANKNKYAAIRLDAYSGNERTQKFYLNRGYKKAGEIYFPFRTAHFNCYEKLL